MGKTMGKPWGKPWGKWENGVLDLISMGFGEELYGIMIAIG